MTRLLIMGGFLGSGKTSAILQMARYLTENSLGADTKVVILENEIGQVSIDDQLISSTGLTVEPIFSGCVCCTMSGELMLNVQSIINRFHPDWIILETTGLAYPKKIRESLKKAFPELWCGICGLIDAKRWAYMQSLETLSTFSREQLEDAEVVLVNKSDLATEDELKKIDALVLEFNKEAELFHVSALQGIENAIWDKIFQKEI